jgi:hypothetical protein
LALSVAQASGNAIARFGGEHGRVNAPPTPRAVLQPGNLRRYLHDRFGLRGGGSFWLQHELELFAGLGVESAAAPDSTLDPVFANAANIAIAAGSRYAFDDHWFVAGSYTHLQFFTRDNTGKSHLADPDIQLITCRPDGGDRYTQ